MIDIRKLATAALFTAISVTLLSGCTPDEPPVAPNVESAVEEEPSEEITLSERGNVIKKVGEGANITNKDGEELIVFGVDSIELDPGCTNAEAMEPENGHFLVVSMTAETGPSFEGYEVHLANDWKVIAENGTTVNSDPHTYAATTCMNSTETIPLNIGRSEKLNGKVVLDVPVEAGYLVLSIATGDGWEWQFPES